MKHQPHDTDVIRYRGHEVIRLGRHLYGVCDNCNGWVKLTGLFKGIHLCQ